MAKPHRVIYYTTFRSNDMNEYSTLWHHPYYQNFTEGTVDTIAQSLNQAADSGATSLEVRGGEPLLNPALPEILRNVRNQFHVTIRTNGLVASICEDQYRELLDEIELTLFHPEPELHNRILGAEGHEPFYETAQALSEQGFPAVILFVVTQETIMHLPEAFEFAESLKLPLRLEPHYISRELRTFERMSIDSIRYYGKRKNVQWSSPIEKRLREDAKKFDRLFCGAGTLTTTVMPDGSIISPCVYSGGVAGVAGKLPACEKCSDWSYLLSSHAGSHFWPREEATVR